MILRNKRNGITYDTEDVSCLESGMECWYCPIQKARGEKMCSEWIREHPKAAGQLMGYEILPETRPRKPKICDILGVEVGERFTHPGVNGSFWISEYGALCCDSGEMDSGIPILVNHPDLVQKLPPMDRYGERGCKDPAAALKIQTDQHPKD